MARPHCRARCHAVLASQSPFDIVSTQIVKSAGLNVIAHRLLRIIAIRTLVAPARAFHQRGLRKPDGPQSGEAEGRGGLCNVPEGGSRYPAI